MQLLEGARPDDSQGVLSVDIVVRLLDISARGCLLESFRPMPEGTIGSVHLEFGGVILSEKVRVARCQRFDRAGTIFRVGTEFLQTEEPEATSLRHAVSVMRSEHNNSVFVE